MENKKNGMPADMDFPWCDDRAVEAACAEASEEDDTDWVNECFLYNTPKRIYDFLDQRMYKQEAAKKAAAITAYKCFEKGIKSNIMFVGPSGCGKTYIWRLLKKIFPDRIEIMDSSSLSLDGWKGTTKWKDLFRSNIFYSGKHCILVLDEADKMLAPKYSTSENVSHSIQAEGLTLLEGRYIDIKDGSVVHEVNTSKISFVFCGAFSAKAAAVAEKEGGSRIGFGAAPENVKAYGRHLTGADLIEYGVMPEFMGRIQQVVNLEPMTEEDYYRITNSPCGPLTSIRRQYGVADITLTAKMRRELAATACKSGLGIRGMENRIRQLLDEAMFEDCDKQCFRF